MHEKVFTQIYSLGFFELFLMTGINKLKFIFCTNWGKCGFRRSKNAKIQTSLFIRSFLKFSLISGIQKKGNFFFFFNFSRQLWIMPSEPPFEMFSVQKLNAPNLLHYYLFFLIVLMLEPGLHRFVVLVTYFDMVFPVRHSPLYYQNFLTSTQLFS